MLCLLGSRALAFYCDIGREPADYDFLGSYEDCNAYIKELGKRERIRSSMPTEGGKKIVTKTDKAIYEFEIAWPLSDSEALLKIIYATCELIKDESGDEFALPALDILYTLKMSHRYRKNSPHFLKTLKDIYLMRDLGATIPEQQKDWYEWRQKETYTNVLPKLNVKKTEFFTDSVPYTYEHDTIHLAVMFKDRPAYTFFKEDQSEVMVSKEMFFKLPREIQLLSVVEEAMTLAIERALVPYPNGLNPKQAFDFALSKVCTSIASGFWREFAYDNYFYVQAMYDPTYFDRFKLALAKGVVLPYK